MQNTFPARGSTASANPNSQPTGALSQQPAGLPNPSSTGALNQQPTGAPNPTSTGALNTPSAETEIDPKTLVPADAPFSREFDSREELLRVIKEYGMTQGYVISVFRSSPGRNAYIGCDRGGDQNERDRALKQRERSIAQHKQRRTRSRRTGCEFKLYAKRSASENSDGKWRIKVINYTHNHELCPGNMIEHPGARVITPDQKKMITFLLGENMPPRKIVNALKQGYPDLLILPRDVYNIKMANRREERLARERELPEQRAKRARLEELDSEYRAQREQHEREHKERLEQLEREHKAKRDYIEEHGHLENFEQREQLDQNQQLDHNGQLDQRQQLEQLQQLQQLQQFDQLEQLTHHVRGTM